MEISNRQLALITLIIVATTPVEAVRQLARRPGTTKDQTTVKTIDARRAE
jgi:hypothetical protein